MYKIIGADQKEYGPSSAEEIRQWVAEGRANAQTLLQSDDSREWRPLASYPEFADLVFPTPTPPRFTGAVPPPLAPANTRSYTAEVLAAAPRLTIGECLNDGWHLLINNFGLLFVSTLLVCGLRLFLSLVPVIGILALLFKGVFYGGLYLVFIKRIRGQPATAGEAFSGFGENFTPLLLVGIISQLLQFFGFACCLIPGVFLFVAWIFAIPLVVDKRLAFWDALELSRKVTTRNWFPIAALLLICFLPVVLFALYSNVVTMQFFTTLVQNGTLDPSLFSSNPQAFIAQMTQASKLMVEKFFYLGIFQQFLLLLVQPFALAVITRAYEVLFNPRPKTPA